MASAVIVVFVVLALFHFYMALRPSPATRAAAIPSIDGKPVFVPSPIGTALVAVVLLSFAGLVAATAGLVAVGLPPFVLRWLSFGLSAGLLARAIGEFKYVGFFKRVRGSRFAHLDTVVYSPLCVLLSAGVAGVALQG